MNEARATVPAQAGAAGPLSHVPRPEGSKQMTTDVAAAGFDPAREVPLKAFAITENNEGTGGIVFAKHAVVARRVGAAEFADGDFGYVSCRRAHWADSYADDRAIPISAFIENGWHFECTGCGNRIDADLGRWQDRIGREDTFRDMLRKARRWRSWKPSDVIGTQHSAVFCDQKCEDDHKAFEAERKRREERALDRFRRLILRRFPGVTLPNDRSRYRASPHAYAYCRKGKWRIGQVCVPFDFPGAKYGPAELRYDADQPRQGAQKPRFTCASGDWEVFQAWAAQTPTLSSEPSS